MVKASIDFIGFNRAMVALQATTGQSMRQVLRSEVGHILKECAAKTKVGTESLVDRKAQLLAIKSLKLTKAENRGDVSINANWRKAAPYGQAWIKVRHGAGRKNYILARGPDFSSPSGSAILRQDGNPRNGTAVWLAGVRQAVGRTVPLVEKRVSAARKAIGLARQSWVQIANSLGINLAAVPGTNLSAQGLAKAQLALASDGKRYANGLAREYEVAKGFVVELTNRLPYCRTIKLDAVLARAINKRSTYFSKNVARGVFSSAKKTLAKYPGLFVSGD